MSGRLVGVTVFSKPAVVSAGQTLEAAMAEQGVEALTIALYTAAPPLAGPEVGGSGYARAALAAPVAAWPTVEVRPLTFGERLRLLRARAQRPKA